MLRYLHLVTLALVFGLSACGGSSNSDPTPIRTPSSDPAKNTAIADIDGAEQVQPKITAAADGSWWISWFSSNPKSAELQSYNVYLQRLHANGKEQFAHQGIEAAKMGVGWTQDYGLTTDSQGNALLAFQDDSYNRPSRAVTATLLDPSGKSLWSTLAAVSGNMPHIASLPDGQTIVGWTIEEDTEYSMSVHLQKFDALGQPVWKSANPAPKDLVFAEAGSNVILADLQAAGDGTVIASLVRQNQSGNHLFANKISTDGRLLWGTEHVTVFDGGSLQMGNFPRFVLDGRGGAVFTWYSVTPQLQVHAQHVLAHGGTSFAHNGVAVSNNLQQARVEPTLAYQASTDEITLFWTELSDPIFQNRRGLYAQKIDSRGALQWGASGLVIHPLGEKSFTHLRSVAAADGTLAFWVQSDAEQKINSIQAIKLDAAGTAACAQFAVSTRPSAKSKLTSSVAKSGLTLLAWEDQGSDRRSDIYIQSVHANCQLGTH